MTTTPILKLLEEPNKTIALLGNFNINLVNFDTSDQVNTFLDDLASNSLQPQTLLPTRVCKNTKHTKPTIYIPYPLLKTGISCNILSSISDHLPHIFILPDLFSNSTPTK